MPLYDYKCNACDHVFEADQRMTESALTTCPKCKKDTLRRVIGVPAIAFKGGGFYATDSRKPVEKESKPETASTPDAKPAAAPTPPTAESKPAASTSPASPK